MDYNNKTNRLGSETSPYLLQHAKNPVDWYPWGADALEKAKSEDKPILVSIGYAACHWCHVMEKQSFEKEDIAQIMNAHFVCIKVDREERPDLDQIYMDALQAMGLRGGWPLNVFLTPDAKPFYGGTYFPPPNWIKLLTSIAEAFGKSRRELEDSAQQFTSVLNMSELEKYGKTEPAGSVSEEFLIQIYEKLRNNFDSENGGMQGAPKFPMPSLYTFLLRYHHLTGNAEALEHVNLTLMQMAFGGIYDQAGGGFARYSVDASWLVPHFEKMLYDNGQLVSLYSEAFMITGNDLYSEVVDETVDFILRELSSPEGGFYSSIDADSEGEEGKFYVWTKSEIDELIGADEQDLFCSYYNITEAGNWEEGDNILHRKTDIVRFANKHNISVAELSEKVKRWKQKVLSERRKRERPGLDDKILAGWNGLTLKALTDAYKAFGRPRFLEAAVKNAQFIKNHMLRDGKLYRSFKDGKLSIPGFLEDYAQVIRGFTGVYEVTFDEQWLHLAHELSGKVMAGFYDPSEQLFFFTSAESEQLIARKKEVTDNVIPASNSTMAQNLFQLGALLSRPDYSELAVQMLNKVQGLLQREPGYFSNWGVLYFQILNGAVEIAIAGPGAQQKREELQRHFIPETVVAGATEKSSLPLLMNRVEKSGPTRLYVCRNSTCRLPVSTVGEVLKQIAEKPAGKFPEL